MSGSELAAILRPRVGFLLGKHDDVAPAHLVNGYLAAAFGVPKSWQRIRDLVTGVDVDPNSYPALTRSGYQRGAPALRDLQSDLDVVVNPDRRGWQTVAASFAPVHLRFVTRDPSDDANGAYLWAATSAELRPSTLKALRGLLEPAAATDPLTLFAMTLTDGVVEPGQPVPPRSTTGWFAPRPRKAIATLRQEMASVIEALANTDGRGRIEAVQHLIRGIYFVWYLGLLLAPLAAVTARRVSQVSDIHEFLVFADVPPGRPDDPLVVGSSRSLQETSQELHEAYRAEAERALETVTVPDRLPGSRQEFRIRVLLGEAGLQGATLDKAVNAVPRATAGNTVSSYAGALVAQSHSPEAVSHSLRTVGRMIGLAGPARGFGAPRFLLETPMLSTLVRITVPEPSIPFADFVDRLRTRFGMIVGIGNDDETPKRLSLWDSTDATRDLLIRNEDALRSRLISAGLAYQYSDLNTEVFGSA